jgi:YbbR domain-containing protein
MSSTVYNFLHRSVLHNLGLRLLSLALAVGLWLALAGEPVSEVAVDALIELHNMPPNLEISSESIPKAQVRLRGPERIIRRLQPSDVFAEVELNSAKPGERTFDLKIHRPRELTVVQVVPSDVHLAFDLRLTRELPVQPRVSGSLAVGYQIGQIQVEPTTITVTGPKQRLDAIKAATTDSIDLTGVTGRMTFARHPYVSDPLIQVASPDPVRIVITIEKTSATSRH